MASRFDFTNDFTEFIMESLAGLQLLTTLAFLVFWISLRKPLCLEKYDADLREAKEKAKKEKMSGGEEKRKKEDFEIEGWDLLMGHYEKLTTSVGPFFEKTKDRFMDNMFVRHVFIAGYALATYESSFLSILMFVSATIMGNFVGI